MPSFLATSPTRSILDFWAISMSLGTALFAFAGIGATVDIWGDLLRGCTQYRNRQNGPALTRVKLVTPAQARGPMTMHPHEALIREFYAAFARRDAEGMARCYHPDVFFSDTVFPALRAEEAGDMWRMLLSRAADLEVTLDEASGDADGGRAKWTARYTFSRTGRKVVNRISAM